jgi:pimeloyl-ACP methyl ester carboxylesterase
MSKHKSADSPQRDRTLVTAAQWFAGGQRIQYDPESGRVLTEEEAPATPGALQVFDRVEGAGHDPDTVRLTLLPGFPDGSYGWAQVDRMLGDDLGRRLYVEPVGQGDSDKPQRWDLAAIAGKLDETVALYVGGSGEDAYEHRQIPAVRQLAPEAKVLTFPGGHLTTSEHPDLLAAAIRDIAARHHLGHTIHRPSMT